ncbi:MAG: T9SS type A sorting domain-containing protein [Bacteroidota bacterium]|nr:T9SS type A sorting domain-containing protein [Bacteroidota bacterium]
MQRYIILILVMIFSSSVFSQDKFRSGIFLHHSTGDNIWGPNGSMTSVPDEIFAYNNSHSYTGDQICSLNESNWPGNSLNNEWSTWHRIFDNEEPNADINQILQSNKIVIIKSCFPSSQVSRWGLHTDTLNPDVKSIFNYKWHWRNIISEMESHPENVFVIWTNAPLVNCTDVQANYSHMFCIWAKDTLTKGLDLEYGAFPDNVYVFDYFHKLVGLDHRMKLEYAVNSTDSHPNSVATELVAPQLVEEIFDASIRYESIYSGILQTPVQSSPSNSATGMALDVSLMWGAVTGATSYKVEVSSESDFSTTVISSTVTGTSFTFSNELTNNMSYYWRVRSVNGEGESAWSGVWSFTVIEAVPGVPVQSSPSNSATGMALDVSLMWGAVTGATSYKVEVSSESDFSTTVISSTVTGTSFTFSNELTNNTSFYWRVRSVNGEGESAWSGVWSFTTTIIAKTYTQNNSEELIVYPNPTKGIIFINLKELGGQDNIVIWLYNRTGKLVYIYSTKQWNGTIITLNINDIPSGVYFMKIKSGEEYKNIKIILK